jgi:uncharacterized repeat protein (TIGR03803 family)
VTIVHNFTSTGGDGNFPVGDLLLGQDGDLYGTTWLGGANAAGTVFRVDPRKSAAVLNRTGATP